MIKSRKFKLQTIRILSLICVGLVIFRTVVYLSQAHPDSSLIKLLQDAKHEFVDDLKYPTKNDVAIHSSNYNSLFTKINFDEYLRLNAPSRCDLHFKNLYVSDQEWYLDPLAGFDYKKEYYKPYEEFQKDHLESLDEDEAKKADLKALKSDYDEMWKKIVKQEQLAHDYMTYLRLYNKCYVDADAPTLLNLTDLTTRMFPWLTLEYPHIEDFNGHKLRIVDDPDMVDKPWIQNWKKHLSGKGIVLTISDSHLPDTLRLIKLLRFLQNKLPIQIVFFKNLSKESRDTIVHYCRTTDMSELAIDHLADELPMQEVYFVNVANVVKEPYLHKFEGFGNKVLATMFNTFNEMILMDADTVPTVEIEKFFEMNKYQTNGTIFFKDRKTVEYRPKHDLIFFKKLLPSKFDTLVFNVPQPSNYSLERDFFHGYNHYMESGLVVLDRRKHFFHSFVMAQMNFIYPLGARIYGDKELFWLSFVILGDEEYSFNEHYSAAIGDLTPDDERFRDIGKAKKLKSQELCSNHPAHINDEDDHTLLWFNSGFRFCGQEYDGKQEFAHKKRYSKYKNLKDFETFFDSKLEVKYAVIPPSKTISVDNTDGESNRAWLNMRQYCNGYTWCAYSSIGDEPEKDPSLRGHVIEYSSDEVLWYAQLGDVWTSALKDTKAPEKKEDDMLSLDKHTLNELKKEAEYYNNLM